MGFVLMILFGIRAYAAEATLTIGNNKNSLASYEPVKGGKAGSALFFDAAYMSAYKGCRLTEVKIGVSDKTTDGAITIFLSHAIDEEPFYKETVDASKSRWKHLYACYALRGGRVGFMYRLHLGRSQVCLLRQCLSAQSRVCSR